MKAKCSTFTAIERFNKMFDDRHTSTTFIKYEILFKYGINLLYLLNTKDTNEAFLDIKNKLNFIVGEIDIYLKKELEFIKKELDILIYNFNYDKEEYKTLMIRLKKIREFYVIHYDYFDKERKKANIIESLQQKILERMEK